MSEKRNFTKAADALNDLEKLLEDKIVALHHAIQACELRQDPSIAIMVSHRHAYIMYRNLVNDAQRSLNF